MSRMLDALFGRETTTRDYETEYDTRHREVTANFTRRTVRFTFVRGEDQTITYDAFDGRYGTPQSGSGIITRISDGIVETERAGVAVEKLCNLTDVKTVWSDGENILLLYGTSSDEVVIPNVTSRHIVSEDAMQVAVPIEEPVTRRTDTGEIVSQGIASDKGDMEIRPVEQPADAEGEQ